MSNFLYRSIHRLSPIRCSNIISTKRGRDALVRVPEHDHSIYNTKTCRKAAQATMMLGCLFLFGCAELNGRTAKWVRDDCINYEIYEDVRVCTDGNNAMVQMQF
jgi:hypothetical protein